MSKEIVFALEDILYQFKELNNNLTSLVNVQVDILDELVEIKQSIKAFGNIED